MATLIPSINSCVSRMTNGERRLGERLEAKLNADYLLWYDVPMGPRNLHPDFCVLHPRRGILVLEVKDWKTSTILKADKQSWEIMGDNGPKTVINPLEQARQYAHQVVNALERDPQLMQPDGPHAGKLAFPWSYGVVLPNITRKQFEDGELHHAIERSQIPGGQYQAVMIDEGHDFAPEWLKLITQMVDPATNSLLVLYDDAQSIYERGRSRDGSKQFSFKSVGIQAQGRTTILKINYRNTRQILHTASLIAADLLTAEDKDDDGIPLVKPVSCGAAVAWQSGSNRAMRRRKSRP